MEANNICVVHLVRKGNDINLFTIFLNSYLQFQSGMNHDLIFVFKGYKKGENILMYTSLLKTIDYKIYFMNDFGMDIQVYKKIAEITRYDIYLFLNSHSEILSNNWLIFYYKNLKNNIGLIGATSSFESLKFGKFGTFLNMFNNYFYFFKKPKKSSGHIRTNAFMIKRNLFLSLRFPVFANKTFNMMFESGENSMTIQVERKGLICGIVSKEGHFYTKEKWKESMTFRYGNQKNLLIADNRTRNYINSSSNMKTSLELASWGHY